RRCSGPDGWAWPACGAAFAVTDNEPPDLADVDSDASPGGSMAAGGDFRADQPGVAVDNLQRLWAPWRYGYVANGDRIDGCPFCTLPARGNASDRASLIVYRSTNTFVIFNAYPYNPGHLMVV